MASSNIVQGKWNPTQEEQDHEEEEQDQYQEEEEEEEALSLSDLPINLNDRPTNQEQHSCANKPTQEEFNFRSWGGPFSKQPEMCVADEVFFKGQILPLRVSFSSEAGLLATLSQSQPHYGKQFINESLDFPSNSSSRSSSLRSQNSSTSTTSSTTTSTKTVSTVPLRTKPRIRNQFHMHPSPKPQLRAPNPAQLSSLGNPGRKSTSAWRIFRLGVVPAPEIGLQDLKVRNRSNCVSRNSSSNSSSSNNSANGVKTSNRNKGNDSILKQLVGKGGGLLSGCDCSLETVRSNKVMIKGGNGDGKSGSNTESTRHAAKEKVMELKKQKHKQKQGKKVTSRRRTFEWLKELHVTHPDDDDDDDEEALLSNA
ncbi:unnamed protein product [Sphenostylis stenocarpa]|uniref:Uncharacterized protein n=1 Tax=Sphenostylis stenocarpa TaxID=92480 RepID=A0AA86V990_9FABA|nr:unnamed protein product [Sphenostylis stenocarpa]